MTVPNELLRAHVTRVGFNLTLTKNQIAELVYLAIELADGRTVRERAEDGKVIDAPGRHLLTNHVASRGALITRGLVVHYPPSEEGNRDGTWIDRSMRDNWSITAAGRCVIDLLKQSGLWDEVAGEIPWRVPPSETPPYLPEQEIAHLRDRAEKAEQQMREMRGQRDAESRRADKEHAARVRADMQLARLQDQVRDLMAGVQLVGSDAA